MHMQMQRHTRFIFYSCCNDVAMPQHCRFSYKPYLVLERLGIKGPQPMTFFGNAKEMKKIVSGIIACKWLLVLNDSVLHLQGFLKFVEKYCEKYGSVWG